MHRKKLMPDIEPLLVIQSFEERFPDISIDCVELTDWLSDTSAFADENYILNFYACKSINGNATITYELKGKYRYRRCKHGTDINGIDMYSLSAAGEQSHFWVQKWNARTQSYELLKSRPDFRAWQGQGSVWDISLKQGEAVCFWGYDEITEELKRLEQETDRILDLKYQSLEKLASAKKYKPGWIYHRMKEPVPEITQIWREAGYYFPLDSKASRYAIDYKWKYFKQDARREMLERLEESESWL